MDQDKISAVIAWLEEKEKSPRHTSAVIHERDGYDEFMDRVNNGTVIGGHAMLAPIVGDQSSIVKDNPCETWKKVMDSVLSQKSGLFPLPKVNTCQHPQHNVPMHLYIPTGHGYRHVCPGCGNVITVVPKQITL